jgi:transcriptional regulator with XRE-family HTH domain
MLSDTLKTGLQSYGIGAKVRALRTAKDIGLAELGKHTGLSPALLSKIERSQMFPTLPTLLRIAMVFGVGLEHFFVESTDRAKFAIVRKKDRLRFPDRAAKDPPSYIFESLDFPVPDRKMEAYYAEFPVHGKPSEPHSHAGAEIIYILAGQLAISIDGNEAVLSAGDAMYFDSRVPHSYRRNGRSSCAAVVVVASVGA